jgi:L-rhamnose-H+ transport protein
LSINWLGVAIAGMMNGSFAVPMKRARAWKFEHVWGVFSLLAMVVIPWCAVLLAVPGWHDILASVSGRALGSVIVLGLLWGVSALLYGLAIDLLGIALGFAIQLGLSIVAGSLIPFALVRGFSMRTPSDVAFLMGVALMVAGVIVCAWAGTSTEDFSFSGARFRKGLVIALLGGLGSPLLNFGIQYGISLLPRGAHGASLGQWVVWSVFLSAAAVSQSGFCLYRITVSKQMQLFCAAGSNHDLTLVLAMSGLWAVSIFLYGVSAANLGRLGTSVGWPVFIGLIAVTSSAWSVMLGEWKNRPRRRLRQMIGGCATLIIAAFIIGQARTKASW